MTMRASRGQIKPSADPTDVTLFPDSRFWRFGIHLEPYQCSKGSGRCSYIISIVSVGQ